MAIKTTIDDKGVNHEVAPVGAVEIRGVRSVVIDAPLTLRQSPTSGSMQVATADYAEAYAESYADAGDAATLTSANLGSHKAIRVATTNVGTTFTSTTPIPSGAYVYQVRFLATTAYDSGIKVTVGTPTNPTDFVALADNFNASDTGISGSIPMFLQEMDKAPTTPGESVRVTLSSSPTVGSGAVTLFYYVPQT